MSEETTLTVKDGTAERFKQLKAELDGVQDAPDHTHDTFLNALLDTYEAAENGLYENADDQSPSSPDVDMDAFVDELIDELGAKAGGPHVDDSQIAREVVAQFDYAALAKATADELETRLR